LIELRVKTSGSTRMIGTPDKQKNVKSIDKKKQNANVEDKYNTFMSNREE
jgi:hypothetical protein